MDTLAPPLSPAELEQQSPMVTADWNSLPEGVLIEILERLSSYDQFQSMNLVSRQWRSAWKKSNFRSKSLQLPFLIIPGGRPDSLRLYSIAHRRSLRRRIEVSDPDLLGSKTCCISSNGWLLSVVDGGSVTIFNPFSLCRIKLPDVRNCVKVVKFVMWSNPSLWDSEDYLLAIGYGTRNGGSLAKWRAGDDRWSYLNEEGSDGKDEFVDVAFCRGELYVLCACSRAEELLVCIVEDYHYESDEDVGETKVRVGEVGHSVGCEYHVDSSS